MKTVFEIRCFSQSTKRFLHLSDPRGAHLGTVNAERSSGLTGVLNDKGELVSPDMREFRNCVPHQWRKAFDNAPLWWNKHDNTKPASMTLYSTRGRLLGTIYATARKV